MTPIYIKVENKKAWLTTPTEIICDNSNYVLEFTFDSEWDEYPYKTARFFYNSSYEEVIFEGNTCTVPPISKAVGVFIGVYAGDLVTTTPAYIPCVKSILDLGGEHADPPEDVYIQIIDLMNQLAKGTASAKAYETYVEMVEELNALERDACGIGQRIYVATENMPDLWVYDIATDKNKFYYTTDKAFKEALEKDKSVQVGYFILRTLGEKLVLEGYVTDEVLKDKGYLTAKDIEGMAVADHEHEEYVSTDDLGNAINTALETAKNSGDFNGAKGDDGNDGVGIASVTQTTTSTEDGGKNEITVELTNGVTSTFEIRNGRRGEDGEDGVDGKYIVDATVNTYGQLVLTLSDGTTVNAGNVVGAPGKDGTSVNILGSFDSPNSLPTTSNTLGDAYLINGHLYIWDDTKWVDGGNIQGPSGKDGVGIASAYINADGQLVLTLSSGVVLTAGKVVGTNGEDGEDGSDGVGIASIEQTTLSSDDGGNNEFTITLTNGEKATFSVKNGSKGSDGEDGLDGEDGKDGITPRLKLENGEIFVSYDEETSWTSLGYTKGADGADGEDGIDGITPAFKVEDGTLYVSYNNGKNWSSLGIFSGSGGNQVSGGINGIPARIGEVTLTASAWEGSGHLYSQVVTIDGVTINTQVDLTPSVEQLCAFYEKDVAFVTENEYGVVTVYCIGQKPVNDYTIQVTLTEVGVGSSAKIGEVTLTASAWQGSNNLYSQVANIEGVTENTQVDLTPSVQQLLVFYEKDIAFVTENEDGVVTVYCIGQKPENDYTIQVTMTEVD